jgi:hypothetical protein
MDIHRLHRLTQIKRIKALDGKFNHLWPSVKSVDKIMIEAAVAGWVRATTTLTDTDPDTGGCGSF